MKTKLMDLAIECYISTISTPDCRYIQHWYIQHWYIQHWYIQHSETNRNTAG